MPRNRARPGFGVFLDADELGGFHRVGVLRRHDVRGDLPASFEYDEHWLRSENAFLLDPRLVLYKGEQYPPAGNATFGIFMDSAPDPIDGGAFSWKGVRRYRAGKKADQCECYTSSTICSACTT